MVLPGRAGAHAVIVEDAVHVALSYRRVVVGVGMGVSGSRHGGLQVGPLGVLPLALVRVLVPAEGLGGRKVATAIVALELPPCLNGTRGSRGGGGGGAVGCVCLCSGRGRGRFFGRGIRLEFDPEEANGGVGRGGGIRGFWRGADKRKLGEGVYTHEVAGLVLAHRCVLRLKFCSSLMIVG